MAVLNLRIWILSAFQWLAMTRTYGSRFEFEIHPDSMLHKQTGNTLLAENSFYSWNHKVNISAVVDKQVLHPQQDCLLNIKWVARASSELYILQVRNLVCKIIRWSS